MIVQRFRFGVYNNVVDVGSGEVTVWLQNSVNHLLDVCWGVSIAHDCYLECLLTSVGRDSKLVAVLWFDPPLVEKGSTIHCGNVGCTLYSSEDVCLTWYWISVRHGYSV